METRELDKKRGKERERQRERDAKEQQALNESLSFFIRLDDESSSLNSDLFRTETTTNNTNYHPHNPTIFDG
jgi:hypothetical protein